MLANESKASAQNLILSVVVLEMCSYSTMGEIISRLGSASKDLGIRHRTQILLLN